MNTNKIKGMKTLIYMCMTLCVLLAGCGGGDEPDPYEPPTPPDPPAPNPTITVNPTNITLPATGGEQTFTVTVNPATTSWSVAASDNWAGSLTVTKESNTVKVKVAANTGNASRSATVTCTITGTNTTASATVTQPPATDKEKELLALAELLHYTGNPADLLTRAGVTVEGEHITKLDLKNSGLSGAIPASISQLKDLWYLDLSGNKLSGAAPDMTALTKLVVLDVSSNELTSLPVLNANLPNLEYLAFNNGKLSGDLPAGWAQYKKLIYIDLSGNAFTGSLPNDWSVLTNMVALHLYGNQLSGAIPAYLPDFKRLKSLALNDNNLMGTIPANLGALPLETLWLSQNRLSGAIPASLLNNPNWKSWESPVCPQQSGYGFSNAPAGTKSAASTGLSPEDWGKRLKEEYGKR